MQSESEHMQCNILGLDGVRKRVDKLQKSERNEMPAGREGTVAMRIVTTSENTIETPLKLVGT